MFFQHIPAFVDIVWIVIFTAVYLLEYII